MYLLGHLGLGYGMVKACPPLQKIKLPLAYLFIGTLLPDLIDKPIYYGLSFFTGEKGKMLGLIAGTRTFGHTLLFFILLLSLAYLLRSKKWLAMALGVLTHLILDQISDLAISGGSTLDGINLFWPFMGWQFPEIPYHSLSEQLSYWQQPIPLTFEGMGLLVLVFTFLNFIMCRKIAR
jgi:membrane-bound metal-dependent hydrolase YbcI (DUF457 family)